MENNKKKGGDTMAKLPGVPVLKFRKALIDAGYTKDRCNGGHEIWKKIVVNTISIPIHDKEINGAVARRLSKEFDLGL